MTSIPRQSSSSLAFTKSLFFVVSFFILLQLAKPIVASLPAVDYFHQFTMSVCHFTLDLFQCNWSMHIGKGQVNAVGKIWVKFWQGIRSCQWNELTAVKQIGYNHFVQLGFVFTIYGVKLLMNKTHIFWKQCFYCFIATDSFLQSEPRLHTSPGTSSLGGLRPFFLFVSCMCQSRPQSKLSRPKKVYIFHVGPWVLFQPVCKSLWRPILGLL